MFVLFERRVTFNSNVSPQVFLFYYEKVICASFLSFSLSSREIYFGFNIVRVSSAAFWILDQREWRESHVHVLAMHYVVVSRIVVIDQS
mgnify:CR=1 FL=1